MILSDYEYFKNVVRMGFGDIIGEHVYENCWYFSRPNGYPIRVEKDGDSYFAWEVPWIGY